MRTVAKIDGEQIAKMNFTISVTMTVDEWRGIMRGEWPTNTLKQYIAGCLGHVSRSTEMTFVEPKHENTGGD